MKLLVETVGDFMLMDTSSAQEVPPDRPGVVENTNFLSGRVSNGQVKVLAELVEDATDAEFLSYFVASESDGALAVESFLSKFGVEQITKKAAKEPKI